jgi:hypothetical protein
VVIQKLEEIIFAPEPVKKQLFEDAMFGVNYAQGRHKRLKLQIKIYSLSMNSFKYLYFFRLIILFSLF